jgi:hypothetical protein
MPPIESYFGSYTITSYEGGGPLSGLMKVNEQLTISGAGNGEARLSWSMNSLRLRWIPQDGGVLFSAPAQLTEHGTLEVPLKSAGTGMPKPREVAGQLQLPAGDAYTIKAAKA